MSNTWKLMIDSWATGLGAQSPFHGWDKDNSLIRISSLVLNLPTSCTEIFHWDYGQCSGLGLSFTKHGIQSFPCVPSVPVKLGNLKERDKEPVQLTKQNKTTPPLQDCGAPLEFCSLTIVFLSHPSPAALPWWLIIIHHERDCTLLIYGLRTSSQHHGCDDVLLQATMSV